MSGSVAVTRAIAVPGLLLLLIIATALSLLIGAKSLPASVVLEAFSGTCQSADCTIVLDARLPRTLAGLLAGGALGLAGALMQTLTRNPLADPGLLGVNAGASFAIVLGAALFGYSSAQEQLAMAFAGALVASLIVAFTGSQGGGQLSPVRLTLAGVALAAVLEGLTSGIALLNPDVYDQLRRGQADRLSPVRQAGLGRILSAGQEAAQGLMCRTYRKQLAGATQSLPPAISTPHNFKRGLFNGPRFSLRTNRADCAQMSMRFALLSTVKRALLRTERVFCPFCGLVR